LPERGAGLVLESNGECLDHRSALFAKCSLVIRRTADDRHRVDLGLVGVQPVVVGSELRRVEGLVLHLLQSAAGALGQSYCLRVQPAGRHQQQKPEQPKTGESPSPSPNQEKQGDQQQKGEGGKSSPTPGPGSTPPATAQEQSGSGNEQPSPTPGEGENAEPSATPAESPQKKFAGEVKGAGEDKSQKPADKDAQLAEAEVEKEGQMSERQAEALLESMKDEEARVQLNERRAARRVYNDW